MTAPDTKQDPDLVPDEHAEPTLGAAALFSLGLLWFAAMLWSAHASIAGANDPTVVVASAALALPTVVSASLVAGLGAGLAAAERFAADAAWRRRLLVGIAGGLACGAFSAGLILIAYGAHTSIAVLAATVGGASLLGGALGSLRPQAVVGAGLAATLSVFVADVVVKLFEPPLKSLFGAGDSRASQVSAAGWFSLTLTALSVLAAGLMAWAYLRRRDASPHWLAYLVAGATPGAVLLLAYGIARLGGASLLSSAAGISEDDQDVLLYTMNSMLNHGLWVTFFGAIVALIAFGRSLPRGAEPAEPLESAEPVE